MGSSDGNSWDGDVRLVAVTPHYPRVADTATYQLELAFKITDKLRMWIAVRASSTAPLPPQYGVQYESVELCWLDSFPFEVLDSSPVLPHLVGTRDVLAGSFLVADLETALQPCLQEAQAWVNAWARRSGSSSRYAIESRLLKRYGARKPRRWRRG